MIVKTREVRDNFKKYCDAACAGEVVYVSRTGSEGNVVIVSEQEYNKLEKLKRLEEIEAAVARSMDNIKDGKIHTSAEIREHARKMIYG